MASSVVGIGSPEIGAVILAGGSSTRMGTDKASLVVGKTPLLARVASALANSVEGPIIVVGRAAHSWRLLAACHADQGARRFWDYMCVDDAPQSTGPADALCLGVEVLLRRFPTIERVVVSPCDLHRITADGFGHLLDSDRRSTIDVEQNLFDDSTPKATVVRIDGRPQWLSAVLHQPLLDLMTRPVADRGRRVSTIFADAVITWFDDVDHAFVDADTPIDLRNPITTTGPDKMSVPTTTTGEPATLADAS